MTDNIKTALGTAAVLAVVFALGSDEPEAYATPQEAASFVSEVEASYSTPSPAPKQNCHPSYSGCLNPNASDYDCAGGSGNGPYYTGTVQVYGYDEFDLDRDGDGWGCE